MKTLFLLKIQSLALFFKRNFNTNSATQRFIELPQLIDQNYTLDEYSAYTPDFSRIASGLFVQINAISTLTIGDLTWVIGPNFPEDTEADDRIILDATDNWG